MNEVLTVVYDLPYGKGRMFGGSAPLFMQEALGGWQRPVLAFYSHVEIEVREQALAAGIERVVARSRSAREGPALLAGLLATAR